jgi:hypothetical protein
MSNQNQYGSEKNTTGKKLLTIIIIGFIIYILMKKLLINLHVGRIVTQTSFTLNIDITTPYLHTGTIDVKTNFNMTSSISP